MEVGTKYHLQYYKDRHGLLLLDIFTEALYLSVDPHMRTYMARFPLGVTMLGDQIAKYQHKKYPVEQSARVILLNHFVGFSNRGIHTTRKIRSFAEHLAGERILYLIRRILLIGCNHMYCHLSETCHYRWVWVN